MLAVPDSPFATQTREYALSARTYLLTLEVALWHALDELAQRQEMTTFDLLTALYDRLPVKGTHASSVAQMNRAVPVFLTTHYRQRADAALLSLDATFSVLFPERTSSAR